MTGGGKDISSIHPANTKCQKEYESFVEYTKVIKCVESLGKSMFILVSYVKYKKASNVKKGLNNYKQKHMQVFKLTFVRDMNRLKKLNVKSILYVKLNLLWQSESGYSLHDEYWQYPLEG